MFKIFIFMLGGFLAVLLIGFLLYVIVKRKLRSTGVTESMAREVVDAIKSGEIAGETNPRSLSGMDSLLFSQIKKDFPDFNVDSAKKYAADYIKSVRCFRWIYTEIHYKI